MPIDLTVVTPEGQAYDEAVESVVLPGAEGVFGVLAGHEVFMTALQTGEMSIDTGSETLYAAVSKGFAEVHEDAVTVMVGSCEFAHEIDLDRAKVAAERAKAQLDEMRDTAEGEAVYAEYQESYSKAIARVSAAERK
jgi:F-type H+-transporting ATPase subunit epsilon